MTTQKRTKLPDFSPSAKVFAKRVQKLQHIEASRKYPLAFLLQYLGYLRPTHRANQIFVPPAPATTLVKPSAASFHSKMAIFPALETGQKMSFSAALFD